MINININMIESHVDTYIGVYGNEFTIGLIHTSTMKNENWLR